MQQDVLPVSLALCMAIRLPYPGVGLRATVDGEYDAPIP